MTNDEQFDPDYTPDVSEPVEYVEQVDDVRVTFTYDGVALDHRVAAVLEQLAERRGISPSAMASEILRDALVAREDPGSGHADAA